MNEVRISMTTVRFFKRIMRPVAEEGIISLPEYNEAISQLTCLAEHGIPKPAVIPKLLDQQEVAEMLGISHSNFKNLKPKVLSRSKGKWSDQRCDTAIPM